MTIYFYNSRICLMFQAIVVNTTVFSLWLLLGNCCIDNSCLQKRCFSIVIMIDLCYFCFFLNGCRYNWFLCISKAQRKCWAISCISKAQWMPFMFEVLLASRGKANIRDLRVAFCTSQKFYIPVLETSWVWHLPHVQYFVSMQFIPATSGPWCVSGLFFPFLLAELS